jgi:AAA family ATP:ADP antiporter
VIAGITLVARSPYLLGICLLILFYTTLSTFLYFQQAEIIRDRFGTPEARTSVFAMVDFAVNATTIVCQLFVTGRLVNWIGIGSALAVIPLVVAIGFLVIGFAPVVAVLLLVQVIRRAGNYAIMRPAREMLFTVVGREEKYKAKNFIDTTVYRGGDAVSAWAYTGLGALGLSFSSIAFVAVPLALAWAAVGYCLGRRRERLAADRRSEEVPQNC